MAILALVLSAIFSLATAQQTGPASSCPSVTMLRRASFRSYVALGDSYAAGLGSYHRLEACSAGESSASPNCTTTGSKSGANACDKDEGSYAWQFAQSHVQPGGFLFPACSGADTAAVNNDQLKYLTPVPDLVTVQVGGDNNGVFADVLIACLGPQIPIIGYNCGKTVAAAKAQLENITMAVNNTLDRINKIVPSTTSKALIGYVQFFGLEKDCSIYIDYAWYFQYSTPSLANRALVNALVADANQRLMTAAAQKGFLFVNADPRYQNHRWCDTQDAWWLISKYNNSGTDTAGKPYDEVSLGHPSYEGQQAYLAALNMTLFGQ